MIIALIVSYVAWYVLYWYECFLNGGDIGRDPLLMPFQLFWQDLQWILPGGLNRRAKYIEEMVQQGEGIIGGFRKSWNYQELRRTGDYRACARDVLPGVGIFFLNHIFVPGTAWLITAWLSGFL